MSAGFDDASVYRIDLASGHAEELTPHQGKTLFLAGGISPDGKIILVTSNQKAGYQNVAILDVAGKQLKWITDTQWEAQAGDFSPNGKLATWVLNADGITTTYVYDVGSGKSEAIAMPTGLTSPDGTPTAFSSNGKSLLISHQSSQRPSDFWVYDMASHKPRQLTYSAVAGLKPDNIPEAKIITYKSFDGKMISAILWMPFNLKRDGSNRSCGAASRWSNGSNIRLFQLHRGGSRVARLHLHRSECSWIDRLRHGLPESKLPGSGRGRLAG